MVHKSLETDGLLHLSKNKTMIHRRPLGATGLRLFFSLMVFLCLGGGWGRESEAQDDNYQNFLLGQRAAGMGGAFTSLANDPSASFYNPAGLAHPNGLQLGLSLNLYGMEFRQAPEGLSRQEGSNALQRWEFIIVPTTAGAATQFGSRDELGRHQWGVAITFLIPAVSQIRFREGFAQTAEGRQRQVSYGLHRDDATYWLGISLARRFGPLSVGLSLFYVHRSFSWMLSDHDALLLCPSGAETSCSTSSTQNTFSSFEGWVANLSFRPGLLLKINNAWQVGLVAGLSSIRLLSNSTFILHRTALSTKTPTAPKPFIRETGLATLFRLPWELRLGVSFRPVEALLIALDLALYAPFEYELIQIPPHLPQFTDLFLYPRTIQRDGVINVHLGGEYRIRPRLLWRWGVYTNFSSSPQIPEQSKEPYLRHIHMVGLTNSISIGFGHHIFDLGLGLSYGQGDNQRYRPNQPVPYQRTLLRQFFIHLYVSGAVQILSYSFDKILNQMKHSKFWSPLFQEKRASSLTSRPSTQKSLSPRSRPSTRPGSTQPTTL